MTKQPESPQRSAVEILNEDGSSPVVLLCEHASNFIPPEYDGLGLSPEELGRHIAWDIGAAGVTRALSHLIDAPAFLGRYSRLLIDLNRPLTSPTSIVTRSESTDIPANAAVDAAERARRAALYFEPFHHAVERLLEQRRRARRPTLIVAIHSFTPTFHGEARPWEAGIIYDKGVAFAEATLERLRLQDNALNVGANVPYAVAPEDYYGLLVYGDYAANPALLVELRQDLLARPAEQQRWAHRLAAALATDIALEARKQG
ncbi:MAG: N-formylglutamate amidohydrolase [Gammaproteobacteria bacterium]